MTFRKSILLLFSLTMIAALVACSSSSSTPPAAITVAVGAVPASVVTNSQTATISATVTNDSANGGVVWSCAPAPCGTFNPVTTASAADTTWTAPNVPNAGVTLTATSVTTTSISNSSAAIPVTGALLADGNYVFSLAGSDENGPYFVAGQFNITTGAITAGEQDFDDSVFNANDQFNPATSTITSTADGNVQIVLDTQDLTIGAAGLETLNGLVLPLSTTGRTLITEFDASASGSGEIDAQDPLVTGIATATPTGGYALVVSGLDGLNGPGGGCCLLDFGAIVNVDGAGTISGGANSIYDANDGGATFPAQAFTASTVTAPDTMGRVVFSLFANDQVDFPGPINLVGYIVDNTHTRLVETTDAYGGTLGGTMLNQGANVGLFTPGLASDPTGLTYVAGMSGEDAFGIYQVAAQVTLAAAPTGFVDFNDLTTVEPATPDPVLGTSFAVDANGDGDVAITGLTDGTTITYNLQLYLDGNGNALAISLDSGTDNLGGTGFQQPAASVGAFSAGNFNGPAGLDVTGIDPALTGELDGVGPVTADGTSAITGTVDLNWLNSGASYPALPVTGTFTANADGIFSDGLTGVDVTSCIVAAACTTDVFNYYLTGDASADSFTIETDFNQLTLGYAAQQ